MNIKIIFLFILLLKLFYFSFSNILNDQKFKIELIKNNLKENGINDIKLTKIKSNKSENYIKFFIEINIINDNNIKAVYLKELENDCSNYAESELININRNGIKKFLFKNQLNDYTQYGVKICLLKQNNGNINRFLNYLRGQTQTIPLMTIRPLFYADFNLLQNDEDEENHLLLPLKKQININGINSIVFRNQNNFKLTKLNCILNTQFNPKQNKGKNIINIINSLSIGSSSNKNNFQYSYFDFCIKFLRQGDYFIIFEGNEEEEWSSSLVFFLKIEKENQTKCWNERLELNENLKEIFESMRYKITITLVELNLNREEEREIKEGLFGIGIYINYKFDIDNKSLTIDSTDENNKKEFGVHNFFKHSIRIYPLMSDGNFEFDVDNEGYTREMKNIQEN